MNKVTFGKHTQKCILTLDMKMHTPHLYEITKRHAGKGIPTVKIHSKEQNGTQEKAFSLPKLKVRNEKALRKGTSDTHSAFSAIQWCLNKFLFVCVKSRRSTFGPWDPLRVGNGQRWHCSVPGCLIRLSPSYLEKTAPFPSYPSCVDPGRMGWLNILAGSGSPAGRRRTCR